MWFVFFHNIKMTPLFRCGMSFQRRALNPVAENGVSSFAPLAIRCRAVRFTKPRAL